MRTHIDWLTFTLSPVWISEIPPEGFENAYLNALMDGFISVFTAETVGKAFAGAWEKQQRSRAPYTDSWKLGAKSITVFASAALKHFTVEISGHGCEILIADGELLNVLEAIHERITRLDIACDIETGVKPSEFVKTLNHARMRSSGSQISETGETQYVGSQKSERYARVYRYNPPHPRSHLLRVEHVFRKEYARMVAKFIVENGVDHAAFPSGKAFGWQHEIWQPSDYTGVGFTANGASKKGNATLFWLINSAAPAFKRLCQEGIVGDPVQFLNTYFSLEDSDI